MSDSPNKKDEMLLGIDYGKSNIGLAFGRGGFVTPLNVVSGKNIDTAIHEINRLAIEYKVDKIILGLPLSVEGKETVQSREVRRFGKILKIHLKKPVEFVNEYYSTKEATKTMFGMGISKKARKSKDHFSAAVLLKNYYDM